MSTKQIAADWCQSCGWEKTRGTCQVCGRYVCQGCSPRINKRACPTMKCQTVMQQRAEKPRPAQPAYEGPRVPLVGRLQA